MAVVLETEMPTIQDFRVGQQIVHMILGVGKVVSRTHENLGVRYRSGLVGAYGSSWFEAFPSVILPDSAPEMAKEAQAAVGRALGDEPTGNVVDDAGLSIEDRIHLDVTGHLPEDF